LGTKTELIRKLRFVTVDRGATVAEASTAAEMAAKFEAELTEEEKEDMFVEDATSNMDWDNWTPAPNYSGGSVYHHRSWTVTQDGTVYTRDNPINSTGFAERLRRRSPFG
jgi:hypothetical protein